MNLRTLALRLFLAALAFLTMVIAGATFEIGGNVRDVWQAPELLIPGVTYAAALSAILAAHELGHWLMARRRRLPWAAPWLIPVPNLFGTLGTISLLPAGIKDRRALFDVAVAGPFFGLVVAIGLAVLGLHWSETLDSPQIASPSLLFGQPLLFQWLLALVKPEAIENGAAWHPLAFAAWTGMLTTAISLLPIGQLDGGHVAYAVFGRRQALLSSATLAALVGVGVAQQAPLWIICVLILLIVDHRHPVSSEAETPLGRGRLVIALFLIVVLCVCLTSQPTGGWVRRS